MPSEHARLSPSAAERWIECPASVQMEAELSSTESPYAHEGTVAHSLAELKASFAFGKITEDQFLMRHAAWYRENQALLDLDDVLLEMERHTDAYVDLLRDRMGMYPHSVLFLEERLETGVPHSWGTSDAVIVSPQHVEIVDLKYGQGVAVKAEGNPQLRLYACGAMDTYADLLGETEVIRATVHQPRMNHVLTEELTPAELREWRATEVIPRAELALSDDAPFGPSDTACRWCSASGRCRAQLQAVFSTDFDADPDLLEPADIAEKLGQIPLIREWLKAFEEAALRSAYSDGKPIPGYKVVLSGGRRTVTDPAAAIAALLDHGFRFSEVVKQSPPGIGELEKLLGEEQFRALLEDTGLVRKSEGKPALVSEEDKRPAINPNAEAQRIFGEGPE